MYIALYIDTYVHKIGTYDGFPYFCTEIKLPLKVSGGIVKCCSTQCYSWKTERKGASGQQPCGVQKRQLTLATQGASGSARLGRW